MINEPSFFGIEDLDGRLNYERQLTANPSTGLVPKNIRQKELSFSRKLTNQTKGLRRQNLSINAAGPINVGGRTRAVAFDIRNEDVILAGGVSGGMWKSLDGAVTWERKSDPENRNSVTALAQDVRAGREDTWYHGTGELVGNSARAPGLSAPFRGNGIYKSTDNGETWNAIPSTEDSEPSVFNSQFQYIWDLEVNDRNPSQDELIVAAFGGILRSLDGGDTWRVELGQRLFNLSPEVDLNEVNASFFTGLEKTVDGVFYAALSVVSSSGVASPDAGIFVSPDGDDWFEITPNILRLNGYSRIVIGHSPSDPRQCYFLIDAGAPLLLRYTLTGFGIFGPIGSWSEPLEIPAFGGQLGDFDTQSSYNMVVKVDPSNSSTVFLGATNLYRSTDGFTTSENIDWIGGYDPAGTTSVYLNHHPDQHDLVFFPSDPDKMLSANDGGLRLTQDFGADSVFWESRNNRYQTSQFFTVALSQEEDNVVLGGMQDNGTDISIGATTWSGLLGGDGGYVETAKDKLFWFASFQNGQTFQLTLTDDLSLSSFARIDPAGFVAESGGGFLFINPFIVDPTDANRVFVAGGNFLYVNDNVSQIPRSSQQATRVGWDRIDDSQLFNGTISSLDISQDGELVFVGASNGSLLKLTNANRTVDLEVEEVTSSGFPEGFVSSISINPRNSDHVLVTFSNYEIPSVFESTDGGLTFQDISGNLEEFVDGSGNGPSVRWGEIIPLSTGNLYLVGTSTGLYSSENSNGLGTTWLKESSDLLGSSVIPMMDYRPSDGRLAIATHGNGVFTTTIEDFESIQVRTDGEPFEIQAAFPNPFQNSTTIQFGIPVDGVVRVDIYSLKGKIIQNLLWAPQFAGVNSVSWDGTNAAGTPLANGIYIYRIVYNGEVKSGRISLRK